MTLDKKMITGIAVVVGLAVVVLFFVFRGGSVAQGPAADGSITYPDGLIVQDVQAGTGEEAVSGARVAVHYVGLLENGQQFDSSLDRGQPITFVLGAGQVIPGWEEGIRGMKVGGRRVLIIPPALGYGSQQVGPIPANSTLIFQVQLMGVELPGQVQGAETEQSPSGETGDAPQAQ